MASYKDMEVDVYSNRVTLWDLGPRKPGAPPEKPALPKGEPGTPAYDLEMLDFNEGLAKYTEELSAYRALKKEYDEFQRRWGGPYEIFNEWWVDAREKLVFGRCRKCPACAQAPKRPDGSFAMTDMNGRPLPMDPCESPRWVISASSPGHSRLPNRGLPAGVKPGRGQDEQMRRIAENRELFIRQKQQDPVFGQEEMRP